MADERAKIFTPDAPPGGMDPVSAEWTIRQLHRITGTTQIVEVVQKENDDKNDQQDLDITALAARVTQLEADMLLRTRWMGEWAAGTYEARDQVEKAGWLMIANQQTDEDPEPYPSGNKRWLTGLGDAPAWDVNNVVTTTVMVGVRILTPSDAASFRYNFRVFIPTGSDGLGLRVFVVGNPGQPEEDRQEIVPERTLTTEDENKWMVFPLGVDFLPVGEQFDIIAVFSVQGAATPFDYDWIGVRSTGAPPPGQAWHGSNQSNGTRFNYETEGTGNSEANMVLLSPGDEITVAGATYIIEDTQANANDQQVWTQPHMRPPAATYTYGFLRYGPAIINYVDNGPAWLNEPNVEGLFSDTGYNEIAVSNTMYGVDLEYDEAIASLHWDFQAYSA